MRYIIPDVEAPTRRRALKVIKAGVRFGKTTRTAEWELENKLKERGEQSTVRHCDYCAVWMAGGYCGEHLNAAIATLDSALAVRDPIVEPDAFVLRTNLGITSIHFGGRQPLQYPHVTLAEAAIDVRGLAASASDASGGLDGAAEITRVELIDWDGGKSTRESLRLGESSFG